MAVRLIDSFATTEALQQIFGDESVLRAMLDFEVALARAEAKLRIIPQGAAKVIADSADAKSFDTTVLAKATFRAGTAGIPLVKALMERVGELDTGAAGFVHWGATSQDVCDTALVLLLKQTQPILESDLAAIGRALERLSEHHAHTSMLGRTLMQAAPPVTFGLKTAGWLAAMRRNQVRVQSCFTEALVLQLGGAVGTLAALGDQGLAVASEMAADLGIANPDAPWHTHRDRLAILVCALGVLTGTLGKMARDISLLMQSEVGELAEAGDEGRGGSSTMPHKHNPTGCSITLAAANRMPGLVSNFLAGMVQENERGVGGWQAEWSTVSEAVQSAGLAAASMAEVLDGLTVNPQRMKENIAGTRGTIFAERATMLLGKAIGRDEAHRILEKATRKSTEEAKHLIEVLSRVPEVAAHLDPSLIQSLEGPEQYLGVAEVFRQRLLASSSAAASKPPAARKERK
jgi:3-carboxy-cis,cis-muconate cycloisomerase